MLAHRVVRLLLRRPSRRARRGLTADDADNMRTIGILGGMSAASTALYVQRLHQLVRARRGGLHSASLLVRSVDFAPVAAMQAADEWDAAGALLNEEARLLERGGADLLLLATNTMHCVADQITHGLSVPFIHIADATAAAVARDGCSAPGLMATMYTMEGTFFTERLRRQALAPVIPARSERATVHKIIYDELCKDLVLEESRRTYEGVAASLVAAGADSLILGCTEIGMLLDRTNVAVPVYDTTLVHCERAIEEALRGL